VERLFGTLQDRLVKTLRRANVSTLAEANQLLETFLPAFNGRFAKPPAYLGSAYLPWPARTRPGDLFCFKFERVVAKDNTVSFAGHTLVIPLQPLQRGYAGIRVEPRHQMDSAWPSHTMARRCSYISHSSRALPRWGSSPLPRELLSP